jgi:[acyl-carrier-protein] S-malonyltransferase
MQKSAFLFPGQGSQAVAMMSGFVDAGSAQHAPPAEHDKIVRATFDEASAVLGYDLLDIVQNGPEEQLSLTEITQPALLAASIATWRVWQSVGGADPDFMAGHSLGEYSALVAAGALGYADGIGLVAERGRCMQAATPPGAGGMAAILGLDDAALEEVCARAGQELGQVVSCANYNSPGQVVIAGERTAVERACELAVAAGAKRAIPLAVSVPSHCALMRPAAEALQAIVGDVPLAAARIPVIHNVDVMAHATADDVREALVRQLWQPVRWSATIGKLIGEGVVRFVECGPGKVLSGLNRRISREVSTLSLDGSQAVMETQANWS